MQVKWEVVTLYRYFGNAAHMRSLFRKEVTQEWLKLAGDSLKGFMAFFYMAPGLYLTYSYSNLYLVIEGWKELGLKDEKIDKLLTSPYVDRLRRFRNATFHYQKEPLSPKHMEFFGTEEERTEDWIDELYNEFARFFTANTLKLPPELQGQSHFEIAKAIERVGKEEPPG
jgi:hypothetical protein